MTISITERKIKTSLLFAIIGASPLSAHAMSSSLISEHFRDLVKFSLRTGITSRQVVDANIESAEFAFKDWTTACAAKDYTTMLKVISYGETSIQKQLPYGADLFAGNLYAQLGQARELVNQGKCHRITTHLSWNRELAQLKEELK